MAELKKFGVTLERYVHEVASYDVLAKDAGAAAEYAMAQAAAGIGHFKRPNAVQNPEMVASGEAAEKPVAVVRSVFDQEKGKLVSGQKPVLSLPKK